MSTASSVSSSALPSSSLLERRRPLHPPPFTMTIQQARNHHHGSRRSNNTAPDGGGGGIYVSHRTLALTATLVVTIILYQFNLIVSGSSRDDKLAPVRTVVEYQPIGNPVHHLRTEHAMDRLKDQNGEPVCQWYLAESAIPNSGMGVYAGIGLHQGDMVGFPDICIFVSDAPSKWTHLRSHSFGQGSFFGQYEGSNSRAACEGFTTLFNTLPDQFVNTHLGTPILPSHAGLHRATSPGAGSITHHFGMHNIAKDIITAGSELIIDYGDWDFSENQKYKKPEREVSWLKQHGWCVDHIAIQQSTIPHAGRGAFARRTLAQGQVVAPMPLQCFQNRSLFAPREHHDDDASENPEQLFVNYCLQPEDSDMMFFPYGPAANLINHGRGRTANVALQWSQSNLHHGAWLDLDYDEFWKVASPGGLVLEVVALRQIAMGEEILLDYGYKWDAAWRAHVQHWKPDPDAAEYVYPAEMDETERLRTVQEQVADPYPYNLATMCTTGDWDRDDKTQYHQTWREPTEWTWWEGMTYCHIMEREVGDNGDDVYNVELVFSSKFKPFDPSKPRRDRKIDNHVPRRAIRFVEKSYLDDEHLPNAFRRPIELPSHLVPDAWRNHRK